MGLVFLIAAIIIGAIYGLKQDEFIEIFMKGAQDLLEVSSSSVYQGVSP